MQINAPQFLFGRSQGDTQAPRTFQVRNTSANLNLAVGTLLAGRIASVNAQTLTVALTDGGFLELAGSTGMKEGEAVTARVAATTPQLQVSLVRTPGAGELNAADLGLKSGQTLVAQVVETLPGQQALIEINGHQIVVDAGNSVESGNLLPIRIDEESGRVFLTVLGGSRALEMLAQFYLREQDRPRESLGRLLQALMLAIQTFAGDVPEAQAPGEQLQTLLQSLLLDDQTTTQTIERSIEDSGLLMESRLAALLDGEQSSGLSQDLKAVLLKLAEISNAPNADPAMKSLTLQALRQIEQLQLANVINQLNDSAFLWQLPGWPGSSPVYLRMEPDSESYRPDDDDSPRAWQILLSVDLDDSGPIRVDARLEDERLRVIIYAETTTAADLNAGLNELQTLLGTSEFAQVLLAVRPLDQLPERLRERITRSIESMPDQIQAVDLEG